jgi:hypothetical protein
MVRIVVGGRELDLIMDDVVRGMRNTQPEPIREHLVEVADNAFPPKQVLAQVTGWDRLTFTTMEAIRVLTRLGFTCRRTGRHSEVQRAWASDDREELGIQRSSSVERRLAAVESSLAVLQEAVAGLRNRMDELGAARRE